MSELNAAGQNSGEKAGEARRITLIGLVINIFLTAGKYLAGIFGSSSAMIADATHSLSDLLTDFVVYFGLFAAENLRIHAIPTATVNRGRPFRCAGVLLIAAGGLFFSGGVKIIDVFFTESVMPAPGISALIAAGVSVALKEWLYRYTVARRRREAAPSLPRRGITVQTLCPPWGPLPESGRFLRRREWHVLILWPRLW